MTAEKKTKSGSTPANKTLKLRLPEELKDAVIEQAHVKGDLARIILFALRSVDRGDIPVQATKKVTELTLSTPTQANIGATALAALKEWADEEDVSVNSLMIHVLMVFFRTLKRNKSLRDELKLELRTTRGLPIPD